MASKKILKARDIERLENTAGTFFVGTCPACPCISSCIAASCVGTCR